MNDQRNIVPYRKPAERRSMHQQRNVNRAEQDRHWPGWLMVIGIFTTLLSLFTVAAWTLIDPTHLLRALLFLCFIGNLLPLVGKRLRFGMEKLEWLFFNLLAVGPLLTCGLLWLNYFVHSNAVTTEHPVVHMEVGGTMIYYDLADDHLSGFPFARADWREGNFIHPKSLLITEADGCLGYRVVVNKEAVPF